MTTDLTLAVIDGEPRIDSRLVATELGVEHETTQRLVDKYSTQFQELGQLRFENGVVNGHQGGGNPQKYILPRPEGRGFLNLTTPPISQSPACQATTADYNEGKDPLYRWQRVGEIPPAD